MRCDVVGSVVWEAGWERNERERESKLIDHERCSLFLGFARDGVTCTYLILSMELLQRHRDGHLGRFVWGFLQADLMRLDHRTA